MGALFKDICYSDNAAALDAMYSSVPVQVTAGATNYATAFEKVGGVWYSRGYEITSGGYWNLRFSSVAKGYNFPECSVTQNYMDGISLGWMLATSMVLAAAIMHLRAGAK